MVSMNVPYLTIRAAAQRTGCSESTVRRVIKNIVSRTNHPNRDAVQPPPAKAEACKKKGEIFAWKVREDVLLRECQKVQMRNQNPSGGEQGGIVEVLRSELSIKNEYITKQWEVITALNERLREGNILMGSLQKQLSPPSSDSEGTAVIDARGSSPLTSKKSSRRTPRKWFFSRLFARV